MFKNVQEHTKTTEAKQTNTIRNTISILKKMIQRQFIKLTMFLNYTQENMCYLKMKHEMSINTDWLIIGLSDLAYLIWPRLRKELS